MSGKKEPAHGKKGSVLIVDDEPNAIRVLSAILEREGYMVMEGLDCDSAIESLSVNKIDTVIADLKMPGKDGTELFNYVQRNHPRVPFIFLTAYGTIESAVRAVTGGAFYYFVKPPDFARLKEVVGSAVEKKKAGALKPAPPGDGRRQEEGRPFSGPFNGISDAMLNVYETIEFASDGAFSVLVSGEAGTGKRLAARAVHYAGHRRQLPFVAVNCAAAPGELLESMLFGYEQGRYARDGREKAGKFEEAGAGTLFLGEIGELGMPLQAKLLGVLETGEFARVGGDGKVRAGFRLIASTRGDLYARVKEGCFREDLFSSINKVRLRMPALKERMDDLPLLAGEFLDRFCRRENKKLSITDEVMGILTKYPWPGNVRQLKNVIGRAVLLARGGSITVGDLPSELRAFVKDGHGIQGRTKTKTLKELEKQAIRRALSQFGGNKSRAAKALGISRKSFYKKLTAAPAGKQ